MIPGQKLLGKFSALDRLNRGWIVKVKPNGIEQNALLKKQYIPNGTKYESNLSTPQLVVIGNESGLVIVALADHWDTYGNDLRDYYYYSHKNRKPKSDVWAHWLERWETDCSSDFIGRFTVNNTPSDINRLSDWLLGDRWRLYVLQHKDYLLPIAGYRDLDHVGGQPRFIPNTYEDGKGFFRNEPSLYSVYKTDDELKLPIKYDVGLSRGAERAFRNGINFNWGPQRAVIILHGFNFPAKWHFGIWKHWCQPPDPLDRYKPERDPNEGTLWAKRTRISPPPTHNIFADCERNEKDSSCDEAKYTKKGVFQKIHEQIKTYLIGYLKEIVTFIGANPTIPRETKMKMQVFRTGKTVSVRVKLSNNESRQKVKTTLILKGCCFDCTDWTNQESVPTLHLSPVTMYLNESPGHVRHEPPKGTLIYEGEVECLTQA